MAFHRLDLATHRIHQLLATAKALDIRRYPAAKVGQRLTQHVLAGAGNRPQPSQRRELNRVVREQLVEVISGLAGAVQARPAASVAA